MAEDKTSEERSILVHGEVDEMKMPAGTGEGKCEGHLGQRANSSYIQGTLTLCGNGRGLWGSWPGGSEELKNRSKKKTPQEEGREGHRSPSTCSLC